MAALADSFDAIVAALPGDWTDLELDLRLADEERYVDAAVYLVQINAQNHSRNPEGFHWRINVAHRFGHAAAPETVHGTLKLLDDAAIGAELVVRGVREGRVEINQWWGRPESVKQEFRKLRAQ